MTTPLAGADVGVDGIDKRLIIVTRDPINAETPLADHLGILTPTALFFKRNRFHWPTLTTSDWRLQVEEGMENPLMLGFEDLRLMSSRTLTATLECAGNGRSAMDPPAEGEPWQYGAVSTAEWTGVPLHAVLDVAAPKSSAVEILAEGHDEGAVRDDGHVVPFARSMPLDKAYHPDTLLAYAMNGEVLPRGHGFPLRLIVPGWYGMASVKWLRRIAAIDRPFRGFFQHDRYVMISDQNALSEPRPLTEIGIRSLILSPAAQSHLPRGRHVIRGRSWSGSAPVDRVEVSVYGGLHWGEATFTSDSGRYAWRGWEYQWDAFTSGPADLLSRAYDLAGTTQPDRGEWNLLGYANNGVQRVTLSID